jgi:hypothetical protein
MGDRHADGPMADHSGGLGPMVVPPVDGCEDVASCSEHLGNGKHLVMGGRPDGLD